MFIVKKELSVILPVSNTGKSKVTKKRSFPNVGCARKVNIAVKQQASITSIPPITPAQCTKGRRMKITSQRSLSDGHIFRMVVIT
jgi:hypothetical protein